MKFFVFVAAFCAVALARPDVKHILPPTTSYGAPASVPTGSYLPSVPQQSFVQPSYSHQQSFAQPSQTYVPQVSSYGYQSGFQQQPFSYGYSQGYSQPAINTGYQQQYYSQPAVSSGSQYGYQQTTSYGSAQPFTYSQNNIDYTLQPQPVIHKKSYHFFKAPEEPQQRSRITIPLPPPEKKFNYIFVKAPVSPPQHVPVIVPHNKVQEKTVVYVVSPKHEENVKPIVLPAPAQSEPEKPKVVFLKYGSTDEVQKLIEGPLKGEDRPSIEEVDNGFFLGDVDHTLKKAQTHAAQTPEVDIRTVPAGQVIEKVEGFQNSNQFTGSFPAVEANRYSAPVVPNFSGVQSVSSVPSVSSGVPVVQTSHSVSSGSGSVNYGPAGQSGPY